MGGVRELGEMGQGWQKGVRGYGWVAPGAAVDVAGGWGVRFEWTFCDREEYECGEEFEDGIKDVREW